MLNQQASLDRVFHALGDPTRLLLMERLTEGPRSVTELAEPLEMSLPGVLQHLRILEEQGLIRSRKVGRVRTCSLAGERLRDVERWIHQRRTTWERRLDWLGAYLDTTPPEEEDER
jgi:DNA-binding transcriptional ArsR family regulator